MNKTKILAFVAYVAMLAACGSDDGSPPELTSNYASSISPFDTLVVKFNTSLVDLDKMSESNIVLGLRVKRVPGKSTSKELRFIGTNTTPGGLNYFDEFKHDSIVFNNLKNSDGYTIKDGTSFHFSTLRILDKGDNINEAGANSIDSVGNVEEGVTFTGVLDHDLKGGDSYDLKDFYTLELKALDTLNLTIVNRESFNVSIKWLGGTTPDTTFIAAKGKSNVFRYIVGTLHLIANPTLTANDLVPFYINIHDEALNAPPNPYKISVKVARRK